MVLRRIVAALAAALSVAPLCFAAESGVDSAANAQPIIVYYVQRLPFMGRDADGNLTGLLIQPVAKAFAKAGVPLAWRESSTSRQLAIIESNTGRACSLGRYMTADRAAFARFSVPFYQDAPWVGLANVNFKVSGHVRIADLIGYIEADRSFHLDLLALAGNLASKKSVPPSPGTFPVNTSLFTILLDGVILILSALTFFPALSLGPILEHLLLKAGQVF